MHLHLERDSVQEMPSRKYYCFLLTTAGEVRGEFLFFGGVGGGGLSHKSEHSLSERMLFKDAGQLPL